MNWVVCGYFYLFYFLLLPSRHYVPPKGKNDHLLNSASSSSIISSAMARCPLSLLRERRGNETECSPIFVSTFRFCCLDVLNMLSWGLGDRACSERCSKCSSTRSDEVIPSCARTATFVPAHVSELLLSSLFILFRLKSAVKIRQVAGGTWLQWLVAGAVGTRYVVCGTASICERCVHCRVFVWASNLKLARLRSLALAT